MKYPKKVIDVANKMAEKYPSDISKATEEAEKKIRKLPEFNELVDILIRNAVQDLVYDARHRSNVQVRRENGKYGTGAKVVSGRSTSVNRAAKSVYNFHIAGTVLGAIRGDQLISIAVSEEETAEGYLFNARLCRRLSGIVPKDKTVKDAVTERRLRSIFNEVKREVNRGAA